MPKWALGWLVSLGANPHSLFPLRTHLGYVQEGAVASVELTEPRLSYGESALPDPDALPSQLPERTGITVQTPCLALPGLFAGGWGY